MRRWERIQVSNTAPWRSAGAARRDERFLVVVREGERALLFRIDQDPGQRRGEHGLGLRSELVQIQLVVEVADEERDLALGRLDVEVLAEMINLMWDSMWKHERISLKRSGAW